MNENQTLTLVQPVVETPPPAKKCKIERVLGKTINELLKSAPTNPIARAHALSKLRQAIPPELVEYDKIQEWVEANIEMPQPAAASALRLEQDRRTAFRIGIEVNETERGSYSCTRSDAYDFEFTERTIIQAAGEAANLDEFINALQTHISENAPNDGDTENYDYDCSDSDGLDIQYSTSRLREESVEWLRSAMPEKLEEWGEE